MALGGIDPEGENPLPSAHSGAGNAWGGGDPEGSRIKQHAKSEGQSPVCKKLPTSAIHLFCCLLNNLFNGECMEK